MPRDFLPTRDSDLLGWSATFSTLIAANYASYGLTLPQATAYGALHDDFAAKLAITNADGTRTPSAIIAKDEARALLKAEARLLAGVIQRNPATTNPQRSDLGLTVKDVEPTPEPVPGSMPVIEVKSVKQNTVFIRLRDSVDSSRRGKPAGVDGAAVFTHVGETAPNTADGWTFQGNITKTLVSVPFPTTLPAGTRVWFTAFWFNRRKQSGPATDPVGANLLGNAAMAA